jgi:hypothetical protein
MRPLLLTVTSVASISCAMRPLLAILPILGGCVFAPEAPAPALEPVELAPATQAVTLALPHQALGLLDEPALWLPVEPGCPVVTVEADGRERWQGDCVLSDGSVILGSLERLQEAEGEWVAGSGFSLLDPQRRTLLAFDGAVELQAMGQLVEIDASFVLCGLERSCDQGVATVDLVSSLYPLDGYPERYDLALEGVVAAGELEPTTVSGSLSVDLEACPAEAASGSLLLRGDATWGLDFDGAAACDGCVEVAIDGLPAGPGCGDWLGSR